LVQVVQSVGLVIAQTTHWVGAEMGVVQGQRPQALRIAQMQNFLEAADSIVGNVQLLKVYI